MAEFCECNVRILIEKDSERFRRIQRIAEAEGYSFEYVVECAVGNGVNFHIDQNLQLMERGIEHRRSRSAAGTAAGHCQ